ncbi:hypothetical protein C7999DRAFT_35869 [Corynascus novoguineensis]|uniref:Uncharacterized protein n=1 Tax=Corynascus novoguineensis TaxID=1126955 RepID=A0AAN7CN43_9PEZI|nr:hypothetical protein C7999DRAFT_35869 [Corynascus novoguineensis]
MAGTAEGPDGDLAESSAKTGLQIVDIAPDGDIVLDVTFETSKETLKAARKAAKPRPGQDVAAPALAVLKPKTRFGYRVQLSVLKQNSKYFDNLLSDARFTEARSIEEGFRQLSLRNVKPSDADANQLPVVKIHEDDEATRSVDQLSVFEDLLRILHRQQSTSKAVTMHYLAVLAVLADRFDCTALVSRYVKALKYKWPATPTRPSRDDGPSLSRAAEETLRQKILVAWLLDQPLKLHAATRELIMSGSRRWSASWDDEGPESNMAPAWWDLPDDLERELHHRRACILATIASIQQHFLGLYTSRTRQCKLGYDSSASCDSYQLGEMVKFLTSRGLLFLTDFSPFSSSAVAQRDFATVDIPSLLAALKQCPSYQIDKNHTNCGLRTRLLPVLEYLQAMLSSNVVSISRQAWAKDREGVAWSLNDDDDESEEARTKKKSRVFRFTRGLASDQRLRYEGAMAADRMARELFTADEWDWTAEERDDVRGIEFGRWPAAR